MRAEDRLTVLFAKIAVESSLPAGEAYDLAREAIELLRGIENAPKIWHGSYGHGRLVTHEWYEEAKRLLDGNDAKKPKAEAP